MKKSLLMYLLFSFFAFGSIAQTPSKCACNSACTKTLSGTVTTAFTVNANEVVCIPPGVVVNAPFTIKKLGKVCNNGEIYGNITMEDYATLLNEGYINTNIYSLGYSNISNCANMIVKNSVPDHIKGPGMVNYGCSHYYEDVRWSNILKYDTIWGKTFIDGELEITYQQVVVVMGFLQVGDLIISSDAALIIPQGSCVKATNIELQNRAIVNGSGPGYGKLLVTGTSRCRTTSNKFVGMLDLCVNGSTTLPANNYADPTVTFCQQNVNCTYTRCDSVKVVSPPPCAINLTETMSHPFCPDKPYGSITVTPSGGTSPYTYSWSSGQTTASITGLKSGSYTVTLTDGTGCKTSKTYMINPAPISPLIHQSNDTLFALPKGADVYRWFLNGALIPGANKDYLVVTQPGSYFANVTVALSPENSCTGVSNSITVNSVSIMPVSENSFSVQVIPNPNNGIFSIHISAEKVTGMDIELYDIMGRQIFRTEKTVHLNDRMDIDISGYSRGLYFLDVKDKQGNRSVTRIASY